LFDFSLAIMLFLRHSYMFFLAKLNMDYMGHGLNYWLNGLIYAELHHVCNYSGMLIL